MTTPAPAQSNSKSLTNKTMIKKSLITLSLIAILASFGCGPTPELEEDRPENIANILEAHPDVHIPSDTTWERTLYSGSVEQHELSTPLSLEEFFETLKSKMNENEWELYEESDNSIRFKKNDLMASYNIKSQASSESSTSYTLFIEPIEFFE